jgi:hypothetical protein
VQHYLVYLPDCQEAKEILAAMPKESITMRFTPINQWVPTARRRFFSAIVQLL